MGREEGVPKSDPALSISLFPDHWAWSSKSLPLTLAQSGSRLRAGATASDRRGCFTPCPSFKGRVHTRWAGAPHWFAPRRASGLGSVRLFSFAAGRGGGGMNTGCGERVRNGRAGGEGAALGAQSPEPLGPRHAHERLLPVPPAWPQRPPPKTPRQVWGGTQLQNRPLWPPPPRRVQGGRRCSGGQTAVLTVSSFPLVTH